MKSGRGNKLTPLSVGVLSPPIHFEKLQIFFYISNFYHHKFAISLSISIIVFLASETDASRIIPLLANFVKSLTYIKFASCSLR